MPVVIGVDESGTGAWAGPFHVAVVVTEVLPFNKAIGRYLRDSKKLSDKKRRLLVPRIREHALAYAVVEAPVWEINLGAKTAWRIRIAQALREVRGKLGEVEYTLIVDGPPDAKLQTMLKSGGMVPRFEVDADDKFPAVMAASILAKTARNDAMIALDATFPEFGWERNAGYGTPEHWKACQECGVTPHHRTLRKLNACPIYRGKEWFANRSSQAE